MEQEAAVTGRGQHCLWASLAVRRCSWLPAYLGHTEQPLAAWVSDQQCPSSSVHPSGSQPPVYASYVTPVDSKRPGQAATSTWGLLPGLDSF